MNKIKLTKMDSGLIDSTVNGQWHLREANLNCSKIIDDNYNIYDSFYFALKKCGDVYYACRINSFGDL